MHIRILRSKVCIQLLAWISLNLKGEVGSVGCLSVPISVTQPVLTPNNALLSASCTLFLSLTLSPFPPFPNSVMPLVTGSVGAAYWRTACRIMTGHWASMDGGPGGSRRNDGRDLRVGDGSAGMGWHGMAWHGGRGLPQRKRGLAALSITRPFW